MGCSDREDPNHRGERIMKIHVDGGIFSTSGYSVTARGFINALNKREDTSVTIRDIPIQGDNAMSEESELKQLQAQPPTDVDIVLMWGVPELRNVLYNRFPIPEGAEKHHMLSWECDQLPRLWSQILNNDVDRVITPSNFSSQAFNQVQKRLHVVPHGYDPEVFTYKPELKQDDVFRVLFVGTWIRRKSPIETIMSLALGLINTNSEIMIKINYDRNSLARIVTSLQSQLIRVKGIKASQIPKITILNGSYTQDEMNDLYNIADTVVLASRGEAWGMPLLNAMATKTPIITTNQGGQIDFIPSDYEYLIPVLNLELAQGDGFYSPQFGLQWHNPDYTVIQEKIREMFDLTKVEREALGEKLFDHIKHLTWDNVVDNYLSKVNEKLYNVKAKERVTKANS